MLSKLQEDLPDGEGWLYEPKWDGFRAIVFRDGDDVFVQSRDGKPLLRYFPELPEALAAVLPERIVVDGEVVVADDKGLHFDSLQMRIHPAKSRVDMLAGEIPASFVGFDVLALGTDDLTSTPFVERRAILEESAPVTNSPDEVLAALAKAPSVAVTPQTADRDEAAIWFDRFEAFGLDGIIAKKVDSTYKPGDRTMVKIKHHRTADVVVAGYRLSKTGDGVGSLLLGVYDGDSLQYVGHTSSFKAAERRELLAQMKKIAADESFAGGRVPGGPSRWTGGKGDMTWFPVEPILVCEVRYDYLQGYRFRHASRFLRWRTDKAPKDCTWDQLPVRH